MSEPLGYIVARPSGYPTTPYVTWGTGVRTLEAASRDAETASRFDREGFTWHVYPVGPEPVQ